MKIESEVIQKIIDTYEEVMIDSHKVVEELKEAIKPKHDFLKGELVEFSGNEVNWQEGFFAKFDGDDTIYPYDDNNGGSHSYCRKIHSIPINMTKHNGGDCPVTGDDIVMVDYGMHEGKIRSYGLANTYNWGCVLKYQVIHFLGDE